MLINSPRAPSMEGLTFADGSPVDVEAFRGDVVVVFFGYTHCPDVCPETLGQLFGVFEKVPDAQAVFVSVERLEASPALAVLDATRAVLPGRAASLVPVAKAGIAARSFAVPEQDKSAPIHYPDMDGMMAAADLPQDARHHARAMLRLLAEAEAADKIEDAVAVVTGTKMKSMAAGRMGYSTSEVGDLVAAEVAG